MQTHKLKNISLFLLTSTLAFIQFNAIAQVLPPPIPPIMDAAPVEPKLVYRPSNLPITIEDLAKVQSAKMDEEFRKRAGFTSVAPVVEKKVKPTAQEKPLVKSTFTVVGFYGTPTAKKVDVMYQGKVHTLSENNQLGMMKINKILLGPDGFVDVSYPIPSKKTNKKNKPAEFENKSIHSGETLEIVQ
jgi:hypothetical protein